MSNIAIKTDNLSKNFSAIRAGKTLFHLGANLIRKESLVRRLWALRNVTMQIERSEIVAIIGKNGSGKTTLLRVLSGIYEKSSGDFEVAGEMKPLLDVYSGFHRQLSVIDNVYLFGSFYSVPQKYLHENIGSILEKAGVYEYRHNYFSILSKGQVEKLALSIFFSSAGDIFLFDEGFNYIDEDYLNCCDDYFHRMRSQKKTVIISSHNFYVLGRYCIKAIWLDEGRIKMIGPVKEVFNEYKKYTSNSS